MFDINTFFENFEDRNRYTELSQKLKKSSELVFDGEYIKMKDVNIPYYKVKDVLDVFPKELENSNWDEGDVHLMKIAVNLYKNEEVKDDMEAFSLCVMCKDLFPEKTELFDLIIGDLHKDTDNREKYVELFDLKSDIVNLVLFYMS
jgi:hypothetical protein